MIFFVANDGTVISSAPSPVYQGSVNVNSIYLVAPFADNMQVAIAFKLPNGVYTTRYPMAQVSNLTGIVDEKTGQTYNGWQFSLPNEITQYFGTVTVQFFFYSAQSGAIMATSSASFAVEKGVPGDLPSVPDKTVYDRMMENLTLLSEQLNNGEYSARAIYQWNSAYTYGAGEIVYYSDFGEYGVFVKSLKKDNKTQPYIDGVLSSDSWQLISDFNILTELYGLKSDVQDALKQAQTEAEIAVNSAESATASSAAAQNSSQEARDAAESIKASAEYIAEQFATVNSDIAGLREDITNEAHFRGYLETNAEIQALSATPNDYAYSAQSGTVWIYQTETGWTDSSKPVPDQVIPKGTETPLMDGTPQVGNSNTYADALHRHPTDTTRASTAVATQTSNGLMSAADKTKLDGIGKGNVTGVKGNTETTYRTGNVNLTPENIGAVNKSGDTLEGDFKLDGSISAPNGTSPIYILPQVSYEEIDPTHTTEVHLKELLKWICRNYPTIHHGIWIGTTRPNLTGYCIISIYDTSDVSSEGLPCYSNGLYNDPNGNLWSFYTFNYNYGYTFNLNGLPITGGTMTGGLIVPALNVDSGESNGLYVELGRKGPVGLEFHCQKSASTFLDYDAIIQAYNAISTDSPGSGVLKYVARQHEFDNPIYESGSRIYSPNNKPFNGSGSSGSGHINFDSGFKIAWGKVTPSKGGNYVSYGVTFSYAPTIAGICINATSANQILALRANNITTSGFTAYGMYSENNSGLTGGDITFTWIAMGY